MGFEKKLKNEFNLNISRYVSTTKPELVVDINEANQEIKA